MVVKGNLKQPLLSAAWAERSGGGGKAGGRQQRASEATKPTAADDAFRVDKGKSTLALWSALPLIVLQSRTGPPCGQAGMKIVAHVEAIHVF